MGLFSATSLIHSFRPLAPNSVPSPQLTPSEDSRAAPGSFLRPHPLPEESMGSLLLAMRSPAFSLWCSRTPPNSSLGHVLHHPFQQPLQVVWVRAETPSVDTPTPQYPFPILGVKADGIGVLHSLRGKVWGQPDRAGPRMDRWTRHPALPFPEWPQEEWGRRPMPLAEMLRVWMRTACEGLGWARPGEETFCNLPDLALNQRASHLTHVALPFQPLYIPNAPTLCRHTLIWGGDMNLPGEGGWSWDSLCKIL